MGGAGFPTSVKLSSGLGKVDTVIVNGAECEPYITSDDRLMRETPERVVGGLRVVLQILQPKRAAIGIEQNKPEAIAAISAVLGSGIDLLPLHVRYPQGAEKQLIQTVTGRCVPPGGLPAHVGCAVFNAATCAAIYDAVYLGLPLVRRAVTVTGSAIAKPGNFLAPIGTAYSDLVEAAGGFALPPYKVLCGGPMMGIAQYTLRTATIKGNNALTCYSDKGRPRDAQPPLHPLRQVRRGLPHAPHAAVPAPRREPRRSGAAGRAARHGLHRVRLVRLRLPGGHPARAELPHRQKARARRRRPRKSKEGGRREMNEEALKLTLSSSPHAHSPNSTRRIMLDVCIALLPALIGAIVFFGARALTLTALSVAGCVFFEWAYRRIMKKDNTTGDLSAVVTGILVAFVCPVSCRTGRS